MRTYPDCKEGTWIAGFSNVGAGHGENFLIYLMRIAQTFESHYDLWYHLHEEVREAKATDMNPLGDIFRPLGKETQESPFDPNKYHKPCQNHRHKKDYDKDINYMDRRNKRRAVLLVGDVKYSFVWDQYMINFEGSTRWRQKKFTLGEFLDHLREANQGKQ
jgi:hypothetical protein